MDLTGQLSNPPPVLEALAGQDIGTPRGSSSDKAHPTDQVPRPASRTSRRLKPAQVDALVAGYEAGKTMKDLAAEFGISRLTMSAHLHRAKVPIRRGGLGQNQVAEVAALYEAGWSSGRLAGRFDVSADTILKVLRREGIRIRLRRGGPRPRVPST